MMNPYRFGKLPPKVDYRTLRFVNYVTQDIPEPNEAVDLLGRVYSNLGDQRTNLLFPMYANDEIGDCTVAGAAHGITVYHGMVTQRHVPDLVNVIKTYYHLTGGGDTGLYMLDVIRYWRTEGIEDSKIFAFTTISHTNHIHVKQAISLFGGLLIGFQCHEKVVEEFADRKPWKPGKLINAGHAVYVTGYDNDGVDVLTWGSTQRGTWEWWDTSVDEVYALLPPESKLEGFTPGFDFDRLKKDLAEVSMLL